MNPVNLGLIGLGEWPREAYAPHLKDMPAANVVAVAARSDATQQFARQTFGTGITTYADYTDLLQDSNVQAVMVALPNTIHSAGIEAAARSGKHVFFEPPIGDTVEEARRVMAALAESKAVVQVDHELRCLPVMDFVRGQLAADAIGDAFMAKVRLWCGWGYGGGNWNQNPEAEGFWPWLGCWYLDLLDAVFEAAPLCAHVAGGCAMNGQLMDHGFATLTYPGGRVGQVEFSLVAVDGLEIELHVLGTKGEIRAELPTGRCRQRAKGRGWDETVRDCHRPMHGFVGMWESIADFLEAVQRGRSPRAGLGVIRRVHQAMLACAQSEQQGRIAAAPELG